MAQGVGNLNVSVTAATGNARRDINAFRSDLKGLSGASTSAAAGVGSLGTAVTGLGIAAGATAIKLASIGLAWLDDLDKSAGKTGVATEKLAGLHLAADLAGVSTRKLDAYLVRQNQTIADATLGIGRGVEALDKLGLSAAELNSLPVDEQMRRIAVATSNLAVSQDRLNVATALYGVRGAEMLNILNFGTAALDSAQKSAEELGLAVEGYLVKYAVDANDAMTLAGSSAQGLGNSLAITVSPVIKEASEILAGLVSWLRAGVDWFNAIPTASSKAIKAIYEKEQEDKKAAEAAAKHAAAIKAQQEALKPYNDELARLKKETMAAEHGDNVAQYRSDVKQFGSQQADALQYQRDLAENARAEASEQKRVRDLKEEIANFGKTSLQIEKEKFAFSAVGKTREEGIAAFDELDRLQKDKEQQDKQKAQMDKERETLADLRRQVDDFGKSSTEQARSRALEGLTDPKSRSEANRLFDQLAEKERAQKEREARQAVAGRSQAGIVDAQSAEGFAALRANFRGTAQEKLLEENKKQTIYQEQMVAGIEKVFAELSGGESTYSLN